MTAGHGVSCSTRSPTWATKRCYCAPTPARRAGWGGLCAGLILTEAVLYLAEAEWLFWTTVVLCTVGAAVLAWFFMDQVVIISTVTLGAYAIVRGVACYAGHYYNEVTMAKMAKEGLLDDVDEWYWMYVGGFALTVAVGIYVQCRTFKKEKAKAEQKKHPFPAG